MIVAFLPLLRKACCCLRRDFFSFYLNDPAGQSCHLVLNAGFLALSAFFLSLALTANTRLPGSLRHGDSEWRDVNVTYTAAACLTYSRCKYVSRMVKKILFQVKVTSS